MAILVLLAGLSALWGCGGERSPEARRQGRHRELAVRVLADTGRGVSLSVEPPRVRVSLARVSPAPAPSPPLPTAGSDTAPPPSTPTVGLEALHPPILRRPATLVAPAGLRRPVTVELDVRVDTTGRVAEVRWAGGASAPDIVQAAEGCAEAMDFYPALLGGRPAEVWCRQRFEFTPR